MKVLYFIESLEAGGKERRLVELICSLRNSNLAQCEIVLFRDQIHYKKVLDTNCKIHILPKRGKFGITSFFRFYSLVKRARPSIIHAWGTLAATYAIPTKSILKIPLVNSQITDVPAVLRNPVMLWYNFLFSDFILANSRAGLKRYGADLKRSKVIYNGFDFSRIANLPAKSQIKEENVITTKFVIGMVASFSESKDYKTYITAALDILGSRNDVTFLCIGAGDDKIFRRMVPERYLSKIRFLGSRESVEATMSICDIGVLTSFGEGISNALLEFMALGKPVITTNLGGTPELVEHLKEGFLIEKSDQKALRDAMERLLNNEDERREMGLKAQDKVRCHFSMKAMVDDFVDVYKSLI